MDVSHRFTRGARQRKRASRFQGHIIFTGIIIFVLLVITGTTIAQGPTPTPTPGPGAGSGTSATPEAAIDPADATATQQMIDATASSDAATLAATAATATSDAATQSSISATGTGQFYATQTATVRPKDTEVFQPLNVVLLVEPRNTTGSYHPGDELKFTIRVWNSGNLKEGRPLDVSVVYDPAVFRPPTDGSISDSGQADSGTITWRIDDGIFPNEDSAKEFSFKTVVRADLTKNVEGTVQAAVSNRGGVTLAATDPMAVPIVLQRETEPTQQVGSTVQVPQGEGLFRDSGSFALLIGAFFGLGLIGIFGLGALVVYLAHDDESKDQAFTNTTEIFLLLLVLFSVIIMGVQNAIDRESINAIIGGIVGYVAGRVKTRMNIPRELFRGGAREPLPPAQSAAPPPASPPAEPTPPADDQTP